MRFGGTTDKNPLDDIPITSGYCTILTMVCDSGGNKLPNIPINCKDGSRWYNYTTNENGMSLFMINSGSANITVRNYSIVENYNMLDQEAIPTMNVDAPVNTKHMINFRYNLINNVEITNNVSSGRYLDTKQVFARLIGGGGGGAEHSGGGGGAYNEGYIMIDRSTKYNIIIGVGGQGNSLVPANTGGTTSAFGLSAIGGTGASGRYNDYNPGVGGGSGSFKGGNGGTRYQSGYPSAYANVNFNYGGGGAGAGTIVNAEQVTINARINGKWYNRLTAYEHTYGGNNDISNADIMYNLNISNSMPGVNGGASGPVTAYIEDRFFIFLPNGARYENAGGMTGEYIDRSVARVGTPTGYGGGGGGCINFQTLAYFFGSGSAGYQGAVFTTRIE